MNNHYSDNHYSYLKIRGGSKADYLLIIYSQNNYEISNKINLGVFKASALMIDNIIGLKIIDYLNNIINL